METVIKSPGIRSILNVFRGKPAFFINAGPSLDEALPLLPDYTKRAVLFSCDTALPALVDQGIIPDFVLIFKQIPESALLSCAFLPLINSNDSHRPNSIGVLPIASALVKPNSS